MPSGLISNHPSHTIEASIIEGIGNSFGVFSPIMDYFECGSTFYCLQINNETVYNVDPNNPCTVINSTRNICLQDQISVFPNPFSAFAIINVNQKLSNAMLIVYNSMGQEMKCIKNIKGYEIILNRDNLPGGIYFIRIAQANVVVVQSKVVIID